MFYLLVCCKLQYFPSSTIQLDSLSYLHSNKITVELKRNLNCNLMNE